MLYSKQTLRLAAAALAASASVDAFAPSPIAASTAARAAPSTSIGGYTDSRSIVDIPTLDFSDCTETSCDTADLDAEVDTFADPSDRMYSAADWAHNMKSLPNSTIMRQTRGPVGWIAAWSTLVSVVHKLCATGGMGNFANGMCLGATPHSLIASSIGLLLVFRTNSAYQRFSVSIDVS